MLGMIFDEDDMFFLWFLLFVEWLLGMLDWCFWFSVFDDYLIDDKGYRENVLFLLGIIFIILI